MAFAPVFLFTHIFSLDTPHGGCTPGDTPAGGGGLCKVPLVLWVLALTLFLAISPGLGWADTGESGPLTLAAASSLQPVFRELGALYRARSGGKPVVAFASSGILAQQIEQGAPFDLFFSADRSWVEFLVRKKRIDPHTVTEFALGRVALVVRRPFSLTHGKTINGAALVALLKRLPVRYFALANPVHAPFGLAAREILERAGVWGDLRERVVFGENVRQALRFVESGNADAGLVAEGIAAGSGLAWQSVEAGLHAPIHHTVGIPIGSPRAKAARNFLKLLFSRQGALILERHGLQSIPRPMQGATPR